MRGGQRPGPAQPAIGLPVRLAACAGKHGMRAEPGRTDVAVLRRTVDGCERRVEIGPPTRDYIEAWEFRSRADLDLAGSGTVIVMDRALKERLEERAYSLITDGDETVVRPAFGEEMRWLAAYEEFGWPGAPAAFWERYAVLADRRESAMAWLDETLVRELLAAAGAAKAPVPTVLALIRGRCYLRRQCTPEDPAGMDHAVRIVDVACERALTEFAHARA